MPRTRRVGRAVATAVQEIDGLNSLTRRSLAIQVEGFARARGRLRAGGQPLRTGNGAARVRRPDKARFSPHPARRAA